MREEIRTPDAPAAIGPYSQGILTSAGRLVWTAGQLGLDPTNGNLVGGGAPAECRRALENLRAVLEAAGSGLEGVVKTTVFLADMSDFQGVNAVYETFFRPPFPARTTVAVRALPKGALVEIEALAVVG